MADSRGRTGSAGGHAPQGAERADAHEDSLESDLQGARRGAQDAAQPTEERSEALTLALAASKREELCSKISDALAGTVERVVRCDRAAIRSSVLRDIRARFSPAEVKKPEMIDQGVQAVRKSTKWINAISAVAGAASEMDS